ncbi:hypothetical protein BDR03DRAFT_988345 [Suillus americanus]|nr:hypothetical protein BDR03DRAFT_988345 [Suillus americanus]
MELAARPVLGGAHDVSALARDLELPNFPTMIQQFLHNQLHIADHKPPDFDPVTAPAFMGRVSVFSSAAASFYAPSDLSGTGGMQHEHIQATTSWQGGPARNDCIFVSMNDEVNCGLDGLVIARVLHFLGFKYRTKYLRCAVVHWFAYITDSWDPDTGMYLVAPSSNDDGTPDISIIHIDCIFRAAHLVPLYGANFCLVKLALMTATTCFMPSTSTSIPEHKPAPVQPPSKHKMFVSLRPLFGDTSRSLSYLHTSLLIQDHPSPYHESIPASSNHIGTYSILWSLWLPFSTKARIPSAHLLHYPADNTGHTVVKLFYINIPDLNHITTNAPMYGGLYCPYSISVARSLTYLHTSLLIQDHPSPYHKSIPASSNHLGTYSILWSSWLPFSTKARIPSTHLYTIIRSTRFYLIVTRDMPP